ncbi:MAG TPA: hypothetical protein VLA87_07760 [Gaiellaceae bacterium]|nr:hypothetical protein [Gaiellaceae bacterium]
MLPALRTSRKPAYVIAVSTPKRTPRAGFAPYAPAPITPEIRTTPTRTIGTAPSVRPAGFSPRSAQAASGTITTCTLPSTVARPAPTAAIAWCQKMRSAMKKMPATSESQSARRASGPKRRRSHQASRASGGSAYAQR